MDQAGHLAWTDLSGASRSKRGEASEKLPSAFSHLPIGASLQMATFTASVGPSRSIDGRSCCEETLLTPTPVHRPHADRRTRRRLLSRRLGGLSRRGFVQETSDSLPVGADFSGAVFEGATPFPFSPEGR